MYKVWAYFVLANMYGFILLERCVNSVVGQPAGMVNPPRNMFII